LLVAQINISKYKLTLYHKRKNELLNFGVTQIKKIWPCDHPSCEAPDVIANDFADFMHVVIYINRFGHEIYGAKWH